MKTTERFANPESRVQPRMFRPARKLKPARTPLIVPREVNGELMVGGGIEEPSPAGKDENASDRLRRTTTAEVMSVELVSAFSGDREMTVSDNALIRLQKKDRGNLFFSDLLYAISHHYFAPETAEILWNKILSHKHLVSERLGRNVRITVATLDYLSNITNDMSAPTLIAEAYVSKIANLSMRDGMTGLFNHSSCYELLELEFKNHRRYGFGVAVLILDIDDFKSANDGSGHQEGDRILVELAKMLAAEARDSDICCRLGGDEFAVIMRLTNDPVEACRIAQRIRAKAENITCDGRQITISIGVAQCDHEANSPRALMRRADQALYKAKNGGRNQVVLHVAPKK
jgi:diguanylate cyclase (GGDEF)-like protein